MFRHSPVTILCFAAVAAAVALAPASAGPTPVVVTFDDLPSLTQIPTHYGGIIWELGVGGFMGNTGRAAVKSETDGAAVKSKPNAMVNEWGVTQIILRFEAGRADFHGALFAKDNSFLQQAAPLVGFVGFRSEDDPNPLFATMVNGDKPAYLAANFKDVVKVQITAAAGPNPLGGGYYNMDDLSYTPIPVPEPPGILVLGSAWTLVFGTLRRGRKPLP